MFISVVVLVILFLFVWGLYSQNKQYEDRIVEMDIIIKKLTGRYFHELEASGMTDDSVDEI